MSTVDWLILVLSLGAVAGYGVWQSRNHKGFDEYVLASRSLPWYQIGLSVMATQASAITFIAAPGQAYSDGMRFIQFYLGLPLAVIVLCVSFVPGFTRLRVYTAYEYLEQRFNPGTRMLTVILFLFLRAISTAVSLYAPALIISYLLHIPISLVTVLTGLTVIGYTISGGTRAVSSSQMLQMFIIFGAMGLAAYQIIHLLPHGVGFSEAMHVSSAMEKLNALDLSFNLKAPYTVWGGLIGGFFLQLSYFGTDQSQVGRYLTGKSAREGQLGLIFNGFLKIPMQFMILLTGVLVFAFFQFNEPPAWFREDSLLKVRASAQAGALATLEAERHRLFTAKKAVAMRYITALNNGNKGLAAVMRPQLFSYHRLSDENSLNIGKLIQRNDPSTKDNDSNYVFLSFVLRYLPKGTVGIILAMVFLAGMGSVASAYNSMSSCTVIDIYKRWVNKEASDSHYLKASRLFTLFWGLVCILFALYAGRFGNLLEAVNRLGSLFYGTILGVFLCGFYVKWIRGPAVFTAAIVAQLSVLILYRLDLVHYLWLNAAGALIVVIVAFVGQRLIFKKVTDFKISAP